jgi:hypothetical protein
VTDDPVQSPPPSLPAPPQTTSSTSGEISPPRPSWKFWQWPPERILALATVILAAATILLATIAGIQAYILATTDASTRMVAEAAKSSAATAQATLEASARSFKQEQRPYLWTSSFNISNPPLCAIPGGERVCADVHIVNSGRTPAVGVHLIRYATFRYDAESVIKSMEVPPYTSPSGDMLGTIGDKWGTSATQVVDDVTAQDLISGKISIFVYGVVQYYDIFNEYHETGFCSHKLPNNGPFVVWDYGNWMDKR